MNFVSSPKISINFAMESENNQKQHMNEEKHETIKL